MYMRLHEQQANLHTSWRCARLLQIAMLLATFPILVFLAEKNAYAQTVNPMSFVLRPTGQEAQQALTINNTSEKTLTVEMEATAISIDEDGVETRSEADEAFIIFPPSAVIEPGSTQVVRVQYVGPEDISESTSYRVSINQLPIDLSQFEESVIQVVVNFHTLAHVVPEKADAEPIVERIREVEDGSYWSLNIRNAGNRYISFIRTEWTFQGSDGQNAKLTGADIAKSIDGKLMLPNSIRKLRIPALEGFSASDTDIKIAILD